MREGARNRLIDAAVGRRAGILAALLAALILLLVGCSGRPDASGEWEGTLAYTEVNDEEEEAGLGFDLGQDSDGSLTGSMSLETGDGTASSPISSGEVTEDGSVQIEIESQDALRPEPIVFDGDLEGDRMSGEVFGISDEGASFVVEHGASRDTRQGSSNTGESTPETVQSSDDEGDFVVETTASGPTSRELASQYEARNDELAGMFEDLEGRISQLEDPQADLEEALGPETRNPDTFDCASDPVSCQVAELEDQVEQDRETFSEEGYGPAGCEEASEPDYYAAYRNFDTSGGEAFITKRDRLSENADGLGDLAQNTLEKARATREARQRVANSSYDGMIPEPYAGSPEVEPLVKKAEAAEERTNEAVSEADRRYGTLERRAKEALAEAEALYARAGCAI